MWCNCNAAFCKCVLAFRSKELSANQSEVVLKNKKELASVYYLYFDSLILVMILPDLAVRKVYV